MATRSSDTISSVPPMSQRHELEMSSVEAQLCDLYAERQRLEEELGSSQADEILALIDDLNARIADLESECESAPRLDEMDAMRIQLAELVAEREAFLLSVDAESFDEVRSTIDQLTSMSTQPTSGTQPAPGTMTNEDFEIEDVIDGAIDMANDVSHDVSHNVTNETVQDAQTIAKDLRTMAEQLGDVFANSKVTFTGRLHGGQWKLECNNG